MLDEALRGRSGDFRGPRVAPNDAIGNGGAKHGVATNTH
jgi:hypothetical protein